MAHSASILCIIFTCNLLTVAWTQEITYTVMEEHEAYTVGNLATDLDIETSQDTRFQLLTATWENQTYFLLNGETGDISTTQPIDRETICALNSGTACQYELEVLVSPLSQYHFIRVTVIIEDVNDHPPKFSKAILPLEIPETIALGTKIPLETAEDPDVGVNSVQEYSLLNDFGGKFGLFVQRYADNSVSLQLEVTGELDRETRSSYLLTLLAHDGGDPPKTGSVILNVTVLDSNDNAPQFLRPNYVVSIEENAAVGTEILQVEAMDPDWGTNGQIEYSFSSSVTQATRQVLQIDEVTGMITVKGLLDFEQQQSFQLVIRAANRVTNPVPDFTTVTINIIDINDNYPSLTVNALEAGANGWVYISEDTPTGTPVAFVKASDPDGGSSGRVRISLSNTLSDFGLQEVSDGQYFLSTLRTLDREAVDVYNISIQAMDQGSPPKTTISHLVIIVEDINDNPPYFATPIYYANVDENNHLSLPVATLSASDPDEGINADITYQLWTQRDMFAVDASSGVITAEVVLDREAQSSVSLFLSACDHGVPTRCSNATVIIDVQDQNDHQPVFEEPGYQFSIPENQFVNSVVGFTKATDEDTGPNAQLTYAIREADSNGASDFFHIVPQTGKIVTTRVIDFEEHKEFQFTVTAADHGIAPQTSEVLVSITVRDENDNAPEVISPNMGNDTFFIPQSAEAGFLVVPIQASDRDQGMNGQLSYSISGGDILGIFGINTAGQLLTTQKIASSWEGAHEVTIQISDGGTPTQITPLELIVVITDLDFNTSLPAAVFFERFNLTAADFGLEDKFNSGDRDDDGTQHASPLSSWPVITAIVLGSLFILLVLIFLLVHFKRRSKTKPKQVYTVPSDLPSSDSRTSTDYFSEVHNMTPQRKLSTDSSRLSVTASLGSVQSKNIMKWRAQAAQANGTLDSRLGNHQMTTFGSNSDVMSDTVARRTPDTDAEVQKLLTILRTETDAVSDNSNRSSYDSGQGDHDEHDSTQDIFPIQHSVRGAPRSSSCPKLSGLSGQGQIPSRDHYMASPHCTPECATLGHSDQCWNHQELPRRPRSASASIIPQQPIHRPISLYADKSVGYDMNTQMPSSNKGSVSWSDETPVTNVGRGYRDNYGYASAQNYSRSNGSVGTDSHYNGNYGTVARGNSGKQRHPLNNSHNTPPQDHVNNKHYRNSGTPLILSPITEDPMEITDTRMAARNRDAYSDYSTCRGSGDQVYPISTLVRHKNGEVYTNYGHGELQSLTQDAVDADVGYQTDAASGYYPQNSVQTCL
ncbi:protocadherin-11 X-linked-like [Acanthaster planci]|uniref:Protocadherin-11 X-linked-like n=1 Tax=Acanthaster planci TaxID=133434 RepID=A0A8B7Z5P5_ACAPL|nr:protocadherin-11 X-linked-like [Acanthaster planci]XP_022100283.1 protocadherin-11 X-linked-like [Acanthaster planci]XP_022100284.1 protocadherin-11 X-linked-like [Acanthaster planci]XP_022100285.1 protocadherin-11 X-linked-like [Acanthaster planci]XP_022100286.1 protocadherin-11 X-linked-like [Acanthaster planci]